MNYDLLRANVSWKQLIFITQREGRSYLAFDWNTFAFIFKQLAHITLHSRYIHLYESFHDFGVASALNRKAF